MALVADAEGGREGAEGGGRMSTEKTKQVGGAYVEEGRKQESGSGPL